MTDLAFDLYLLAAALGMVPAVAFAGMPLLAQSAFLALGAVGAMQLERAGLPIGSAVLLAVLGGAVAGALVGALVARTERARVALATWGLAWLATTVLLAFPELSGGTQGLTRPALDQVQTFFGMSLTLTPGVHLGPAVVLCALAVGAAERLRNGPAGLDAIAIREDAEAAAALGTPVAVRRASLLAIAGAFGAAAGAGFSLLIGVAAPADTSPLLALQLFAAVIVGAGAPVAGPLLAFAVLAGVPRAASLLAETGLSTDAANGVTTAAALVACLWLRPHVAARTRRRGSSGAPPAPDTAAPMPDDAAPTPHAPAPDDSAPAPAMLAADDPPTRDAAAPHDDAPTPAALAPDGPPMRDAAAPHDDAPTPAALAPDDPPTRDAAAPHDDAPTPAALAPDGPPMRDAAAPHDDAPTPAALAPDDAAPASLTVRALRDPLGILDGIDLELRGGEEVHALIGPNGSGKTTALRVLADGHDGVRRTFQRAAPMQPLTPFEQVLLALPRERFAALLDFTLLRTAEPDPWPALRLTELADRAHVPAGELGAGEERLLQIARAAATGARILLLDEPAAGMRPDEREMLLRVLRRLADAGCAVLVVEHDLRLVAGAADTVTVLDEGRVIAAGAPAEVVADDTVRHVYLGA